MVHLPRTSPVRLQVQVGELARRLAQIGRRLGDGEPRLRLALAYGVAHVSPCLALAKRGIARRSPSKTRDQPMRGFHSRPSITAR